MIIKNGQEVPAETPTLAGTHGCSLRWLITKKDGAQHYAMRLFELRPGGSIPIHVHSDIEHEIFVLDGEAVCNDGESRTQLTPGMVLLVQPGDKHGFQNIFDKPFRFICVIPIE